ncbi:MAG TPA: hypothetical protein VFI97_00145 [Arthrobacter sp.]|nr:hypothetical protein [Arthrobacter sp.]
MRFHLLRYQANTTGYGAEPGQRWDAVLVKACVRDSARSRKGITFSWSPWSLTDKSSGLYPASSSTYTGFPSPEYPFADQSVFRPGDCAKGWIVFGVPDHVTITGVRYGNQMGETATWKVS